MRENRLGGVELAEEIDIHQVLRVGGVSHFDGAGDAHAGVGHQQVDVALCGDNFIDAGAHGDLVSDVDAAAGNALGRCSAAA